MAQPRLAAAVMVLRDLPGGQQGLEVFMVRRIVKSGFMPDLYVFPGGGLSSEDRHLELMEGVCTPVPPTEADPEGRTALGKGIRATAIRELFEEGNILLAYQQNAMLAMNEQTQAHFADYRQELNGRKGSLLQMIQREKLTLATDALGYFAHWITPKGFSKRYDTHFFVTRVPEQQEALYDQLETSEGVWIEPTQALERFSRAAFPLALPTYHQLRDLSVFTNVNAVLTSVLTRYVPTNRPILTEQRGLPQVYLPEAPEEIWNT